MFWKYTRCADGIVNYLEKYLVYGVGQWTGWKGARGMAWVGKVSHLQKVMLKLAKDRFWRVDT
jgi:hypothetical protein